MSAIQVGVVGLGVMGSAMSANLLAAGVPVLGYDVNPERTAVHSSLGGTVATSAAELAAQVDVVITSLPSSAALQTVLAGADGLDTGSPVGRPVVLETSTLPLLDKLAARDAAASDGTILLDCPMSGTGQQTRDRDVVAYLSGDDDGKRRVRDVLAAFTRQVYDLGEFGNGTRVKLVANLLVAVHNAAAGEALLLARRAGLDLDMALRAITDGAGTSRMLEVRGPLMIAGEYDKATMRVSTFGKDIDIISRFAEQMKSPSPMFAAAAALYAIAVEQGRGDQDTASVFAVLESLPW